MKMELTNFFIFLCFLTICKIKKLAEMGKFLIVLVINIIHFAIR